jgi:hypothetical protein
MNGETGMHRNGGSPFTDGNRHLGVGLAHHEPALFITVRREIVEPRRETGAWSCEGPMRTCVVR